MKQLLLFLICNLAFLLTVQGNSAEIPPAVMFKQLSTTEGLSNNSVRSIYRDNRGFLWVGTESGLNKYDGYSFQQYYQNNSDLPDDAISEIFEGPDDNVWIRTSAATVSIIIRPVNSTMTINPYSMGCKSPVKTF